MLTTIVRNEFMASVTDEQINTCSEAIRNAFPHDAERIFLTIRYDTMNGCFMFNYAGMVVGCELDGYIHS